MVGVCKPVLKKNCNYDFCNYYFAREGDPFGTQLPDKFVFKNSYCRYCLTQLFVIMNLILWICKF